MGAAFVRGFSRGDSAGRALKSAAESGCVESDHCDSMLGLEPRVETSFEARHRENARIPDT